VRQPGVKSAGTRLRTCTGSGGFTLVEIIIVVVVVSILTLLAVPRMSRFLGNEREYFSIMTGMIAGTFDDAFLNDRVNYLAVHLHEMKTGPGETEREVFERRNGLSVLNLTEEGFRDSRRKTLRFREFPDDFRIEKALLSSGKTVREGTVLVPFYPQGYSDNLIIHLVLMDEEQWSVRIFKNMKEPAVIRGHVNFSSIEQ